MLQIIYHQAAVFAQILCLMEHIFKIDRLLFKSNFFEHCVHIWLYDFGILYFFFSHLWTGVMWWNLVWMGQPVPRGPTSTAVIVLTALPARSVTWEWWAVRWLLHLKVSIAPSQIICIPQMPNSNRGWMSTDVNNMAAWEILLVYIWIMLWKQLKIPFNLLILNSCYFIIIPRTH